jgi:hypothetical protein
MALRRGVTFCPTGLSNYGVNGLLTGSYYGSRIRAVSWGGGGRVHVIVLWDGRV